MLPCFAGLKVKDVSVWDPYEKKYLVQALRSFTLHQIRESYLVSIFVYFGVLNNILNLHKNEMAARSTILKRRCKKSVFWK